jgi:hypothetical protein
MLDYLQRVMSQIAGEDGIVFWIKPGVDKEMLIKMMKSILMKIRESDPKCKLIILGNVGGIKLHTSILDSEEES